MGTEHTAAMPQIPLFAEPPSRVDELLAIWSRTSEADRVAFLEEVRRAFLYRTKPPPAKQDGRRKRGTA